MQTYKQRYSAALCSRMFVYVKRPAVVSCQVTALHYCPSPSVSLSLSLSLWPAGLPDHFAALLPGRDVNLAGDRGTTKMSNGLR